MSPVPLILIAVVVALFVFKKVGQVSAGDVPAMLEGNAVVVDVRSVNEYSRGHIDGVVNIPMDQFKQEIEKVAEDKSAPLLLHCASGGRSAVARQMAKGMGYTNAHNLGSFARAQRLLSDGM